MQLAGLTNCVVCDMSLGHVCNNQSVTSCQDSDARRHGNDHVQSRDWSLVNSMSAARTETCDWLLKYLYKPFVSIAGSKKSGPSNNGECNAKAKRRVWQNLGGTQGLRKFHEKFFLKIPAHRVRFNAFVCQASMMSMLEEERQKSWEMVVEAINRERESSKVKCGPLSVTRGCQLSLPSSYWFMCLFKTADISAVPIHTGVSSRCSCRRETKN